MHFLKGTAYTYMHPYIVSLLVKIISTTLKREQSQPTAFSKSFHGSKNFPGAQQRNDYADELRNLPQCHVETTTKILPCSGNVARFHDN